MPERSGLSFARVVLAIRFLTGGNTVEVSVLGLACVALIGTIVASVDAALAEERRRDLTFDGTVTDVSRMISNQGGDAVARFAAGLTPAIGQAAALDSLIIGSDSANIPSLAKGGFLHDEVDAFNAAMAAQALRPSSVRSSVSDQGASLLRLTPAGGGSFALSSVVNTFVLTVPSPFADARWTPVRTADWSRGPALLGLKSELHFPNTAGELSAPAGLNGQPCWVKHFGNHHLVYCGTNAGADVGGAYGVGLTLGRRGLAEPARLLAGTPRGTWLRGVRAESLSLVRPGDVLYKPSLGPLLVSDAFKGSLAEAQWLNGNRSVVRWTEGTASFFGRASRSMDRGPGNPLTISINSELSGLLDESLASLGARHSTILRDASVVVANVTTGELLAVSELGWTDGKPLRAFEPILLGSMAKPMVAGAILSQMPELAALQVAYSGSPVKSVAGLPLTAPFENPDNGCPGTIDFDRFLECSSNQFAAELIVRSLQRSAGTQAIAPGGLVPTPILERSPLTNGLIALFGTDVVFNRDNLRSNSLWTQSGPPATSPAEIPRDAAMWPYSSRPWFICGDSTSTGPAYCRQGRATELKDLARFSFGAWENRWSLLGVAEAYSRIATGRRVLLTLRKPRVGAQMADTLTDAQRGALHVIRSGLTRVGASGTAAGVNAAFDGVAGPGLRLVVLSKTGTLNDEEDDVYLKSLAIVAGQPLGGKAANPAHSDELACGLVAIVHLTFQPNWISRSGRAPQSALPNLHVAFARNDLAPLLQRMWPRLGTCRNTQ